MPPGVQTTEPRARAFAHDGRGYIPIDPASLVGSLLPMDLYLRHMPSGNAVLYQSVGVTFTAQTAARLADSGVHTVYVVAHDHGAYRRMLSERLEGLLHDPAAEPRQQAEQTRAVCAGLIEDVLASPGRPEAVQAIADISHHLADLASRREEAFSFLVQMSAHDYYTATHMLNVAVGCGLLFKRLRPADRETLPAIIQGGLLHDIGKRNIPQAVLNKVGKLTPKEWQLVRAHPRLGHEELRGHPGISAIVLEMVRDHHERLDGRGYPNEVGYEKIGFAARVCAVADVYDALTSSRQYRKALSPRQALVLMTEGVGTHFDPGIVAAWFDLVERVFVTEAAGLSTTVPSKLTLSGFLPHCEVSGAPPAPPPDPHRDRRAHPRVRCNTVIRAAFVSQGRPSTIGIGEPFPVLALDLSQSGMQIRTPWPLSLDDKLELHIPQKEGGVAPRLARVVRITAVSQDRYLAGLRFVAAAEAAARPAA